MSNRIAPTSHTTAPEGTRPILAQLEKAIGMVPKLYATIGHSPGSLANLLAWDTAVGKGGLSHREIEQINLHVSELNGCAYCVAAHHGLGARSGLSAAEIDAARAGLGSNARENALLALARRVTRTGGARSGTELARLREAGVSDADIVDALALVAMKAFTNAVALVADTEVDLPRVHLAPTA